MFGSSSKPIPFDPYGRRRKRRGIPGWLLLLVTGAVAGVIGVLAVQQRVLPPRLSAADTVALRAEVAASQRELAQRRTEAADAVRGLEAAQRDVQRLSGELAQARAAVDDLQADLGAVVQALPPDPRDGAVQVRAARFTARDGELGYDLVLTRDGAAANTFSGVLQLVVAGATARGTATTVNLKPVPLKVGRHEVVRGSLPLPDGFKPEQTTVQVLERTAGRVLGMRVLPVR